MAAADLGHHAAQDAAAVPVHDPELRQAGAERLVEKALEVLARPLAVETDELELATGVLPGVDDHRRAARPLRRVDDLQVRNRHPQPFSGHVDLRLRASDLAQHAPPADREPDRRALREVVRPGTAARGRGRLDRERLLAQLLQPAPPQRFMLLDRGAQAFDRLVELGLRTPTERLTLGRQLLGYLPALGLEARQLALGVVPRTVRRGPLQGEVGALGLELGLEGLEAAQPAVELEVLAAEKLPRARQHALRHPHPLRDLEGPRATRAAHREGVERTFGGLVVLHRGVVHGVAGAGCQGNCREVRGHDRQAAPPRQLLDQRAAQGRALEGVGAGAELVEQHQRLLVGLAQQTGGCRHRGREGGEVGGDVLLVADVGPQPAEGRKPGPLGHRQRNPVQRHQGHQPDGLENHGLAARVGPGDHQGAHARPQLEVQGNGQVAGIAPLQIAEDLAPQGVQPLVEQRVPGAVQHQPAGGARHRHPAFDAAPEQHLGLDRVELAEHRDRRGEALPGVGEEPRDQMQDPLHLALLAGRRSGELVVELDHRQGLDEGGRPARRHVEQQARQLGPHRGAHRQAVAVPAQGRRGVGDELAVSSPDALELGHDGDPGARDLAPEPGQLGRGVVIDRAVTAEQRRHPVDEAAGLRQGVRDVGQQWVVGAVEAPPHRRHLAREVEQGEQVPGI